MSRILAMQKVALTAAAFGAFPFLFAGFVTFRANRLVDGEAVFLWQAAPGMQTSLVLALWGMIAALSALALPHAFRVSALSVSAGTLIPVLLATAGGHAARMAQEMGPIVRVSFGPAFWIAVFALIVLMTDAYQRAEKRWQAVILLAALISGAAVVYLFVSGSLDQLSLMKEFANRKGRFLDELRTHLILAGAAVGMAFALGVPLGILAHRKARLQGPTFFALNTLQTVPSLALFGILIPVLAALTRVFPVLADMGIQGIGTAPALIALTVYSLLPVARNTYTGFMAVDPAAVDAGQGMGMTRVQVLLRVEIPIASPIILSGIRIALVQAVGLTAVAALIGAGGFGVFIFQGLGQAATDLILLGVIPTIVIAVVADALMNGCIELVRPKGLE